MKTFTCWITGTIINKLAYMKRKMKPVHPGAILREDVLKEMDLTITKAAAGLEISRKQLSEITNENAAITAEMALRLEQGFGVNAEFWLDMQKKYDLWKAESNGKIRIRRIKKSTLRLTSKKSAISA
jgi:addiction module HigA family antidote